MFDAPGTLPEAFLVALTAEKKQRAQAVAGADWRPYHTLQVADLVAYVQAKKPLHETVARVLRGEAWAPDGLKHDHMIRLVVALQAEYGPITPESGQLFARSCEAARLADPKTTASPDEWAAEFIKWHARGEAEHAQQQELLTLGERTAAAYAEVNKVLVEAAQEAQPFTRQSLSALAKRAKDPNHAAILRAVCDGEGIATELEAALEGCGRWVAQKHAAITPDRLIQQFAHAQISTSGLAAFRRGLDQGHALANDRDAWRRGLLVGENEKPQQCVANIMHVLLAHPDMQGVLVYDERLQNFKFAKPAPWQREASDQLTNSDPGACCAWVSKLVGVGFGPAQVLEAFAAVKPRVLNYDPVAYYLRNVVWDGVTRIDTWLVEYAGCENTAWARAIGRKTLIAAVARALKPGCKVDTVLVLEGAQGRQKSTLIKSLCPQETWFAEYDGALSGKDKDAVQSMASGPWIIELGELSGLNRSEVNVVKQFVSRAVDRFRPPYGRVTQEFPRKTVFIASTNDSEYLQDRTGNRRWWPVEAGVCDPVGAVAVRDQLWAEAVHAFGKGEPWWLTDAALVEESKRQQDQRLQSDPWDEELGVFLESRNTPVTMRELLQVLGLPGASANSREVKRLHGVLRMAGWRQGVKERGASGNTRYWHPPDRVLTFEEAARIVASCQ